MATIRCYTRPGIGTYPDHNYPGHTGYLCDLEHAMHLEYSIDGKAFHPLRNNTGILFPTAAFDEGTPEGTTKTLVQPSIGRDASGHFIISAIRRNRNAADPSTLGSIMLFTSPDLVHYSEIGFLHVSAEEIVNPYCDYDIRMNRYTISWESGHIRYEAWSSDLCCIHDVVALPVPAQSVLNEVSVSDEELRIIRAYLDTIENVGVDPIAYSIRIGDEIDISDLPDAVCRYSDGSTHAKKVLWNREVLASIDTAAAGTYEIPGIIQTKTRDTPYVLNYGGLSPGRINDPHVGQGMSDPCVTFYKGKYYLSSTGIHRIVLRCADTVDGVFRAPPVVVHQLPLACGTRFHGTWAAELHEIEGVLYMFTAVCLGGDWTKVASVILRCHGDPLSPASWEPPKACIKPNGQPCTENGISLDMTYFFDSGRHYVMWSDRKIHSDHAEQVIEPADIYIATVDPHAPWQMTSEPKCIARPIYGWERCETEVIEAPYILHRDDEIFVTISGSSTGMADLYSVGLLRAKSGSDLLQEASWTHVGYPLLTKESVRGEFGPGHNNFVVDHETGDTMMIYHAVPHDQNDRSLNRQPYMRRVHWGKSGMPYLEMTPDRDLNEAFRNTTMTLYVMEPKGKGE